MRVPADIAVYDQHGQISTLVEVKAVPESDSGWAAEIRRNVIDLGGITPHFFLVVARDFSYFWTKAAPAEGLPDQIFKTDELFQRYLKRIESDSRSIAPSALELMVGIWLSDMTERASELTAIEKSGFRSSVANGRVEFLDAA